MKRYLFLISTICLVHLIPLQAQEDADLFGYWKFYSDIENTLYKHYSAIAFDQLDIRKNEVDQLRTRSEWLERQSVIRNRLTETIGPFPEKTPLNTKVTGIIKKDGYRIEKIIYESIPGYYVTGALYIPEGLKDKAPAIFYACGHSYEGFRVDVYQRIIINLVKKGFVVFTIDPMGQGERYEYWNEATNEAKFTPDHEHSFAGAQCLISGFSVAKYFIWDAMRGIDFMLTRKEIDPDRIGMTGRSGGGNITAYLGALDDRILATAPECYITSYKHLLKSKGPQCAEQNPYQMISKGLDHADFIEARAPKPTMIISTTRDFFSIQGTRDSYAEAKRMYSALGAEDHLSMVEDDDKHTSTLKNREAMYSFFQKQLNNPGSSEEIVVQLLDPEELKVTKTGQLMSSFEAQSIFSLTKAVVDKQVIALEASRQESAEHLESLPSDIARISGFEYPKTFEKALFSGRYVKSGYSLEQYLVPGSGDYVLPVLLLKPKGSTSNQLLIMLDTKGMDHAINTDSLALTLVKKGHPVLLFDLPGIGSMGPGYMKGDSYIEGVSYNQWFAAILAGESFTGLRSEDIVRIVHFIKEDLKEFTRLSALSIGAIGGDLLHAAAFEADIKKVALVKPLLSYANMASTRFYKPEYIPYIVAGAIESYDLPDLMAFGKKKKLLVLNPVRADGSKPNEEQLDRTYAFPEKVLNSKENPEGFVLDPMASESEMIKHLLLWLDRLNLDPAEKWD